jgi:hypothetical protein
VLDVTGVTITGADTACETLALAAGTTSTAEVTAKSVVLALSAEEVEVERESDLVFCSVEVFSVLDEIDFVVLALVQAVESSARTLAADNFVTTLAASFPFSAPWLKRKSVKLKPEFAEEVEELPEDFPAASPASASVDAVA